MWQTTDRQEGRKPTVEITEEIETEWIKNAISRTDEKRFAICTEESGEYIGNVQLTSITDENAEFHIFIGEDKYWGKGAATQATGLVIEYARNILKLSEVYLFVKKENPAAVALYISSGFVTASDNGIELKMVKTLK